MRYSRNIGSISQCEQDKLFQSNVTVVGCGGIGGHAIEMLSRVGVGNIRVVDYDVFDVSNLNRQLLSTMDSIGRFKVQEAKARVKAIDNRIQVAVINDVLDKDNAVSIINGSDVVVDALDNINTRFIVQEACESLGIPMVYGAIAGWYGQVATIMPGDRLLNKIYKSKDIKGEEQKLGNLSFTPATIASVQASEVVKILLNRGQLITQGILHIDLLNCEFNIISID